MKRAVAREALERMRALVAAWDAAEELGDALWLADQLMNLGFRRSSSQRKKKS